MQKGDSAVDVPELDSAYADYDAGRLEQGAGMAADLQLQAGGTAVGNDGADGIAAADLDINLGVDRAFDDLGDGAAEDIAGADLGVVHVGADDDRTGLDDGVCLSAGFQSQVIDGAVGDNRCERDAPFE